MQGSKSKQHSLVRKAFDPRNPTTTIPQTGDLSDSPSAAAKTDARMHTTLRLGVLLECLVLRTAVEEVIPAPGGDDMLHTDMNPFPDDTAINLHKDRTNYGETKLDRGF